MELFALFEEVSDQYGTSVLVGIYDSKEMAEANRSKKSRCYIRVLELNARPSAIPRYAD